MIQRIQTVFLLLAGLLQVTLFKLSFYTATIDTYSIRYTAWQHENSTSNEIHLNLIHILLQFILILITLVTIFKYSDRKQQMRLSLYLALGTACSFLFSLYSILNSNYSEYHFGFGTYVISIIAILYICAYFFIRKDEELVRSADRLR